ncbi:MAG: nucleotide exchange factor GrpE [Pseudomonadales bacterium]|jgi:molecular chaperone GrpE|nr:nucleotide exchange factor GrpE [Pseudomonadales bacterium]MDP7359591.1 nucleotide exchange factor GrpE [Pseudomonadales bacterium]MDP7595808.1 nucleotide exchange factor GrpE [Pseudomonadales bacterium]HJN49960.1 nucleotide exchange factor GrpE [Pseudomonadales bacterium]|tara:strand:+ start:1344 stop:2261 length:918 start_codon:yes stop_codon:yes gene_type:complete
MTRTKTPDIDDDPVISKEEPAREEEKTTAEAAANAADQSTKATKKGKKKVTKKKSAKATVVELQDQLVKANEQVGLFQEQALRAEAEMQNVRKRVARDVENAHKYGTERLLQNLLPTVDSLEKSVEAAAQVNEANTGLVEGIEICLKMLLDVLVKENVEQLDPEGEPFDPQFHEAISVIEKAEMEPNSVALVVQKGYRLNGRLVRPAMVIVSKAVADTAPERAAVDAAAVDAAAVDAAAVDAAAPDGDTPSGAAATAAAASAAAQERDGQEKGGQEKDGPAGSGQDSEGPAGSGPEGDTRIDEKA